MRAKELGREKTQNTKKGITRRKRKRNNITQRRKAAEKR